MSRYVSRSRTMVARAFIVSKFYKYPNICREHRFLMYKTKAFLKSRRVLPLVISLKPIIYPPKQTRKTESCLRTFLVLPLYSSIFEPIRWFGSLASSTPLAADDALFSFGTDSRPSSASTSASFSFSDFVASSGRGFKFKSCTILSMEVIRACPKVLLPPERAAATMLR
jgi:hypothetical protein